MNETATCSGCGAPLGNGAKFCSECDEPSWDAIIAPAPVELTTQPGEEESGPLPQKRFPGRSGRQASNKVECWYCREYNTPPAGVDTTTCRLCGKAIPKPVPPELPEEETAKCRESTTGRTPHSPVDVPTTLLVASATLLAGLTGWLIAVLF